MRQYFLLAVLTALIFLPGQKDTAGPLYMLTAIGLMEGWFQFCSFRKPDKRRANADILSIIWVLLIIWDIFVTKLDMMHPVLVPAPENIFAVFAEDWLVMIKGFISSMEILLIGVILGISSGTVLGLICGWYQHLKDVFFPIANVLAPIPSIVFAPYIIAIMPTFRSASAVVVFLGIFWPVFLKSVISVDGIDRNIIDSARTLELKPISMIFEVLLPYSIPGILSGLKVTMTTAMMLLTFAEMLGATEGMGYYIVNYNTYGNYTKVIAGIIVVAIAVTIVGFITTRLQKLVHWRN
ncbi:MAG: ABC transporter permease subunit [Eubacteriaceae bacterium]|nr:ABC transporter permease subunit [Eubacteriaceae bacterium]